ncbi:MAG: hypothetical protein MI924_29110 [Chloroflexales bacterium]|nr:hypothetical protein [Chloroflexales bacterium]
MDNRLDAILQSCLERIERGDSMEACLRDYPTLRTDLGGLLRTVVAMRSLPSLPPPNLAAIEQVVQARATALRATVDPQDLPPGGASGGGATSIPGWFMPTLFVVAAIGALLLGVLFSNALVSLSARPTTPALPISARTAPADSSPVVTPSPQASITTVPTATIQPVWPTSILLPVPSPTSILLPVPSLTPSSPPPPPAVAPRSAPPPAIGNNGRGGDDDNDDDDDDDDDDD